MMLKSRGNKATSFHDLKLIPLLGKNGIFNVKATESEIFLPSPTAQNEKKGKEENYWLNSVREQWTR